MEHNVTSVQITDVLPCKGGKHIRLLYYKLNVMLTGTSCCQKRTPCITSATIPTSKLNLAILSSLKITSSSSPSDSRYLNYH